MFLVGHLENRRKNVKKPNCPMNEKRPQLRPLMSQPGGYSTSCSWWNYEKRPQLRPLMSQSSWYIWMIVNTIKISSITRMIIINVSSMLYGLGSSNFDNHGHYTYADRLRLRGKQSNYLE